MAAEIEHTFPDVEVELVPGGRGIFDVKRGDTMLFSKHKEDRFPRDGEIPALIRG